MPKEKAAGGEKETSKGGFASEQTPHPSSCPFRCSSSSHTNRFAGFAWEPSPPLQTPLKRPRRGQRPPSLDFPRGLVRAEIISDLQNAIQMRIWQTGEVIEILCVCFDFHTSNIQRAQKSDLYGLSCAWETRFYGRPKGVLTTETKRQNARQNDKLFRRVSAISRPASLFCILFSDKPEKSMSAKRYRTNWVQKGGCNAIPASISRRAVGPQSH